MSADLILDEVHNTNADDDHDPPTVRHAQRSKYWNEWLAAMHKELEALKAKGVYEEVDKIPAGRKPVQCKWVLRIKRDQNGQISRFKGRLIAKGFTQIFSQDFTFTFAPVARWESIRSILCIATLHDFELRHIDVKNAYLNAPLHKEIYMVAPDGSGSKYWRLHKGLYGLRQAGRQWYLHLHEAYCNLGFIRCESDWSVYVRKTPTNLTISATSVNDLLIASNSKTESDLATTQIKEKFAVTDSGDTEWLLGCRIRRWRHRRLLMIDQVLCPLSYPGAARPLMLPLFCLLSYLYLPDRSTAYTGLTSAVAAISMLSSYRPNTSTSVRTMPILLFRLAFPRLSNHSLASCYESSPVILVRVSQFFVYLLRLFCYLLSTILRISQPISKLLTHLLTVL
jgi:hypothetical protein